MFSLERNCKQWSILCLFQKQQLVHPNLCSGVALALVVGPLVVAQAATDADLHAFLDVVLDALGDFAPRHDVEPLRVVHPFLVGVAAALVHGEAEACLLVVVAKVSHFRFCTRAAHQCDRISHCTHDCVCLID